MRVIDGPAERQIAQRKGEQLAVKVDRASQVHHTPHEARPQMEPVTRVARQNTAPTSAPGDCQTVPAGAAQPGPQPGDAGQRADTKARVAHGGHRRVYVKHPDELALHRVRRAHPEPPPVLRASVARADQPSARVSRDEEGATGYLTFPPSKPQSSGLRQPGRSRRSKRAARANASRLTRSLHPKGRGRHARPRWPRGRPVPARAPATSGSSVSRTRRPIDSAP